MAGIGYQPWGDPWMNGGSFSTSFSNFSLDAADDALTFVVQAPETGPTITKVAVRLGALTGTSPVYRLSLQGVALDTGHADGTIKSGSGSNDVYVDINPSTGDGTVVEYTLGGGGYNSSPGEYLAVDIRRQSGTIDGSNFWSFSRTPPGAPDIALPYTVTNNSGSYVNQRAAHVGISDGSTWWGCPLIAEGGNVSVGSDPVLSGVLFTIPDIAETVSCVGAWFCPEDPAGGATLYRFSLYDTDGTTLLASTDLDINVGHSYGNAGYRRYVLWDDGAVALTCGSAYRVILGVDAGTYKQYFFGVQNAAHWGTFPWGDSMAWTQGSAGSWTETATRRPWGGPIISGITEPAAGGSSPRFGDMTGGLR